jgi:hypothetical protein
VNPKFFGATSVQDVVDEEVRGDRVLALRQADHQVVVDLALAVRREPVAHDVGPTLFGQVVRVLIASPGPHLAQAVLPGGQSVYIEIVTFGLHRVAQLEELRADHRRWSAASVLLMSWMPLRSRTIAIAVCQSSRIAMFAGVLRVPEARRTGCPARDVVGHHVGRASRCRWSRSCTDGVRAPAVVPRVAEARPQVVVLVR